MTPEESERLQACIQEMSEILGSDMEVVVRLKFCPALHCSHR